MTEAERQDFALELLEVFADFLCSPSLMEEYEEKGFHSAGMHTRVGCRHEVLDTIKVIRGWPLHDPLPLKDLIVALLPPFPPVEDQSVPEAA